MKFEYRKHLDVIAAIVAIIVVGQLNPFKEYGLIPLAAGALAYFAAQRYVH